MLSFDETRRIIQLRERVKMATYEALREDGHHKSSEAAVTISCCLPSMFEGDEPSWVVEVYSYVLGPHRNHTWTGKTPSEALVQAEKEVGQWCFLWEMKMMERDMGITPEQEE